MNLKNYTYGQLRFIIKVNSRDSFNKFLLKEEILILEKWAKKALDPQLAVQCSSYEDDKPSPYVYGTHTAELFNNIAIKWKNYNRHNFK
jgi:hypothetical protein